MKTDILINNMVQMFFVAIVLEAGISAIFNLTAVQSINRGKVFVDTTREVFTFLGAFFLCYFVKKFRIFSGTGLKMNDMLDLVVTTLVLAKFSGLIGDLFRRLKG